MIKAVIFDVGNVLVRFDGKKLISSIFENQKDIDDVYSILFPHPWNQYDKGELGAHDLISLVSLHRPDLEKKAETMMKTWTEKVEIARQSRRMISDLKKEGIQVLICSNMPYDCKDSLQKRHLFDEVDDAIYSCDVHINKPDPEIWRLLMERNHLRPEDCLFLDDNASNVMVARGLGMQAIQVKNIDQVPALVMHAIQEENGKDKHRER